MSKYPVMLLAMGLSFGALAQTSSAPRLRPVPDLDRNMKTGPRVGARIPPFEVTDQNGKKQTFQLIKGPKGAVLLFVRSADWWPYCKTQLVELEEKKAELAKKGLGVAAITYDSPALLAEFAARKGINYPLLGDSGSKMIRAFGILNDNFPPDHDWYGVPFPGTYVVNEKGVVVSKFFEEDHRERVTMSSVLVRQALVEGGRRATEVETPHLTLRYSASDEVLTPGNRATLLLDIELKEGMHVYASGAKGYKPIQWESRNSTGWVFHAPSLPKARILHLPAIREKVPVHEGRFRMVRDLTVGQRNEVRPLLTPDRMLKIEDTLRYQACDDKICYAPQVIPIEWSFRFGDHDGRRSPEALRKGGDR